MIQLFTDWWSRWNPWPAWCWWVIKKWVKEIRGNRYIWRETNNVAEYGALIYWLKEFRKLKEKKIEILLDSKLVVEQVSKRWKCKDERMKYLLWEVRELLVWIDYKIKWIPREQNWKADEEANKAMDRKKIEVPLNVPAKKKKVRQEPKAKKKAIHERILDELIEIKELLKTK